ncbi:MAG: SUMF1/EgtB/PvdO family nonheme iron enzyme [Bacteroidales bacterium]|nr:SUMF1/EgtB/PvdO family nonheme iron enzyme [Bacteroidales bacterium]
MAKIKHILLYILAAVFLCVTNISFYAQDTGWNYDDKALERVKEPKYQGYKSLPKKARKHFEGMKFIPGGTFTNGRSAQEMTFCDKDSTLLVGNLPMRVTVSSFFISDHEVTNAEYREFVNWVKVRVAMDILAEHYPEKRLPNGQYNQEIPIDWRDIVLDSLLYYPVNESYYRRKEIDTRKLIYTYQYEELNDSLYRINFSDTITNDSSLLWDRNISECMELKEVSIAVYPDTLCWVNDFSYSYNGPMTKMYFWHPAYDNYPVVGVSWLQAAAYCQWRTDRLNEDILIAEKVLKKRSYYFSTDELLQDSSNRYYMQILYPNFRFPTEAEWEYAACFRDDEGFNREIYTWEGQTTTNKKGEYLANFGTIRDQNNVWHKSFDDDGYFHTSEVKHYPPNQKGLYDMAGNVAEWVLNKYEVMDHTYRVLPNDDAQTAFEKVYKQMEYGFEIRDSLNELDRWYLTRYAEQAMHNAKVLDKMQPARGVKGGSWADPAVYIMPGTRTIYNENKSSSRIGFRVAMTVVGGLYDF